RRQRDLAAAALAVTDDQGVAIFVAIRPQVRGHLGLRSCHERPARTLEGEGRLGDDEESHAEWAALGFIYALGVLSCAAARPRGVSGIDFEEHDQWTAADLLRHLRYERGRLVCETDYVRGRMMKTDVTVFPDGRFTLTTTNRGEAASRWVAQIQGKKVLRP